MLQKKKKTPQTLMLCMTTECSAAAMTFLICLMTFKAFFHQTVIAVVPGGDQRPTFPTIGRMLENKLSCLEHCHVLQ